MRGGGSFQFPMQSSPDAAAGGQGTDLQRRGGSTGHNRNSSATLKATGETNQAQANLNRISRAQWATFRPASWISTWSSQSWFDESVRQQHRNFQYGGQLQTIQLPQGQMALVPNPMYPGQQLNPIQMNQLQALQAAQMNGHVGLQGSQHAPKCLRSSSNSNARPSSPLPAPSNSASAPR